MVYGVWCMVSPFDGDRAFLGRVGGRWEMGDDIPW